MSFHYLLLMLVVLVVIAEDTGTEGVVNPHEQQETKAAASLRILGPFSQ